MVLGTGYGVRGEPRGQKQLQAIRGHQSQSEVFGGHQRSSEVISGHQGSCSHLVRCDPFPFERGAQSICGEKRLEDFRGCGEFEHAPRSQLGSDSPQLPQSSIRINLLTNLGGAQLGATDVRIKQCDERLSKPNGAEQLPRAPDGGCNHTSSATIRNHQRDSPDAHQKSSEGLTRCSSEVIRGTHPMLIRGTQRDSSDAHQKSSVVLTRCSQSSRRRSARRQSTRRRSSRSAYQQIALYRVPRRFGGSARSRTIAAR